MALRGNIMSWLIGSVRGPHGNDDKVGAVLTMYKTAVQRLFRNIKLAVHSAGDFDRSRPSHSLDVSSP